MEISPGAEPGSVGNILNRIQRGLRKLSGIEVAQKPPSREISRPKVLPKIQQVESPLIKTQMHLLKPDMDFKLPKNPNGNTMTVFGRSPNILDPRHSNFPGESKVKVVFEGGQTDPQMSRRAVAIKTFPNYAISIINLGGHTIPWRLNERENRQLTPGEEKYLKPGTDLRNLNIGISPNIWLVAQSINGDNTGSWLESVGLRRR